MNKIDAYLSSVDPLIVGAIATCIIVLLTVVKREDRWLFGFYLGPIWMLLNRTSDFESVASNAKVFAVLPFAMLVAFTFKHPDRSSKAFPNYATALICVGVLWVICIAGVKDFGYGIAVRGQWVLMCIAAAFTAQMLTAPANFQRMMNALFFGNLLASAFLFSAIVLDPGAMNLGGHTRFSPWGTNPNQINMTLTMTFFSSLFVIQTTKIAKLNTLAVFTAVLAFLMLVLTLSRSSVAMSIIGVALMAPTIITKKPVLTAGVAAVGFIVVFYFISSRGISLDRLQNLDTGRDMIAKVYLKEISKRPIVGLLMNSKYSFYIAPGAPSHAHNALLAILYNGGALLFVPFVLLSGQAINAIVRLYKEKRMFPHLATEVGWLAATFFALLASSFNNFAIIWSSYFESCLILIVGCFAVTLVNNGGLASLQLLGVSSADFQRQGVFTAYNRAHALRKK